VSVRFYGARRPLRCASREEADFERARLVLAESRGEAIASPRTGVPRFGGTPLGVEYQHYPRAQAEVIVDTTTLIVLGGLGLDVCGETVPDVAGWGENGALDAVTPFAQFIDDLARRVEAALSADGDIQDTAATG
jgi:hypothetical protein